jgi:hypothetical protein
VPAHDWQTRRQRLNWILDKVRADLERLGIDAYRHESEARDLAAAIEQPQTDPERYKLRRRRDAAWRKCHETRKTNDHVYRRFERLFTALRAEAHREQEETTRTVPPE